MKQTPLIVIGLVVTSAVVYACAGNKAGAAARTLAPDAPQKDQISYGVGFYLGQEVREGLAADAIEANPDLLASGFIDGLADVAPQIPPDELDTLLQAVHERMQERMVARLLREDPRFKKLHDDNLVAAQTFLTAHANEPGVVTSPLGAQYRVIRTGTGPSPALSDTVIVNVRATHVDGTEFDSGEEIEVEVEDTLAGGREILQLMTVGSRWVVALPPDLAYGSAGDPPLIGPNEALLFEVELVAIKD